jgi:hypothetical protein
VTTLTPKDGGESVAVISLAASANSVTIADEKAAAPALLRQSLLVLMLGATPIEIEDIAVGHPSLSAAALHVTVESANIVAVSLAGVNDSGRTVSFRFALTTPGERPSPELLAVFRNTVRSLRFEPNLGCRPAQDGRLRRVDLRPVPASAAPTQKELDDARREAFGSLDDLGRGCGDLQQFFTPVTCFYYDDHGTLAMLVNFDTHGGKKWTTKAEATEKLGGTVGAWFCYAAGDKAFARRPELIFETDTPGQRRFWDCGKRGLGGPASRELKQIAINDGESLRRYGVSH